MRTSGGMRRLMIGLMMGHYGVVGAPPSLAGAIEPRPVAVRVDYRWADHARIDKETAAYGVQSAALEWQAGVVEGGIAVSHFDWRSPASFAGPAADNDPWGALYRLRLGLQRQGILSQRQHYTVIAGVESAFENQLKESFSGYLGGYAMLRLSPRSTLVYGLYYARHQTITTDFDLVPILGYGWNQGASEGVSLMAGLPMTQATWHVSERYRLVIDVCFNEGGVFRLDDRNPVRPGGYLERVGATTNLRLEANDIRGFDLAVSVGHTIHQELTFYDGDGRRIRGHDVAQVPVVGGSISRRF